MANFKPRPRSLASIVTRDMNFALGTLARAIANLERAVMVFGDTPQKERIVDALGNARAAYDWLRTSEGKAARQAAVERLKKRMSHQA